MPGGANWKSELSTARNALSDALSGKAQAANVSIATTEELQSARERFIRLYNQVAKRLVRALLIDLGRDSEYRRFLVDLQVHEASAGSAPQEPAPADTDESPVDA